jgi:hypothetical protein
MLDRKTDGPEDYSTFAAARELRTRRSVVTNRSTRPPGRPLIPSKLTLDRPEIVKSRLDLDQEERACSTLERQQIDPAVGAAVHHLDFPGRGQTGGSQASIDVAEQRA